MEETLQVSIGGTDPGGGGEVVQVIMQEDGQIVMPEGQFLQVNTDDGQPQFIQVTDDNGENQLIQLMPDGQARLVQVEEGPDGQTHIIQVAPDSMDLGTSEQGGLTIVNMSEATVDEMTPQHDDADQQLHLQVSGLDGVSGQSDIETLVLQAADEEHHIQGPSDHQLDPQQLEDQEMHHLQQDELEPQEHNVEQAQGEPSMVEGEPQEPQLVETQEPHPPATTIITIHPPGMERLHRDQQVDIGHEQALVTSVEQATSGIPEGITVIEPDQPLPTTTESTTPTTETDGQAENILSSTPGDPVKKKKLDMNSPIPLTTETVVVVNGKRCVLRVDPSSSNLVAYPFTPTPLPGKRGRGRPRKVRPQEGMLPTLVPAPHVQQMIASQGMEEKPWPLTNQDSEESSQLATDLVYELPSDQYDTPMGTPTKKDGLSEQENSAAEGLLGLSEDGVRRSRRKRKRATFLSDYETGAVEGMPEDEDDDSKEGILEGVVKKPRTHLLDAAIYGPNRTKPTPTTTPAIPSTAAAANNAMQTLLMNMGFIPKKRGRGRPRRNPLPTPAVTGAGPIPAFIIQEPGGAAVMMAPIQNIGGLQKTLVAIKAKPPTTLPELTPTPDKAETPASIVIQNADGTETQIITESQPQSAQQLEDAGMLGEEEGVMQEAVQGVKQVQEDEEAVVMLGEAEAECQDSAKSVSKPVCDIMDSGALDDDVADPDYEPDGDPPEEEDDDEHKDSLEKKTARSGVLSALPPAAIIQLPDNLVSLVMPKKAPIKIGLKATESDLEKLKCPKCDFQAYYQQQFQEHIATHIDDIHKCKCCNFLTFEEDGLLVHFRDAHPKCICTVCDFTAEHAYIIKRHMMRHNANGCECSLCGKRYKDQYILKMHIKMVHMPAEVLYECQVCCKKFTRKAHLKRHLRIHEPEKPYKCSHCDYRGCERSDITKHLLIHEEPRHICEVCGKAFRHIKNKELHVKRHKGQRDYKCGVCDFYGYTFTDIRKHIERKHSDNRNILCDKCGSAFKNDVLLRDHQKRQCEMLLFEGALPVEEEVTEQQTIQLVEDDMGHHTIHVPHDQFQVVPGIAGKTGHQGAEQQHIMVNGNHVNITVEQVELPGEQLSLQQVGHLQILGHMGDPLEQHTQHVDGGGEVTVVHMEDVVGRQDDDEEDDEEEDELATEERLNIEEGEVAVEQIVVEHGDMEEGTVTMEEAMLRVAKDEQGMEEVLEGQIIEQQVLEGHVIEGQVMEEEIMVPQVLEQEVIDQQALEGQQAMGEEQTIGEQLLIELVQ